MTYLCIISVVLSGCSLGFGAVILKATKAVTLWEVPIDWGAFKRRVRFGGTVALLVGFITLSLSIFLLYKVSVNQQMMFVALCAFLWTVFLVIGGVWGDFVFSKHIGFSKNCFILLSKLEALKAAEEKLTNACVTVIGFEGIAFISKEGKICDVLYFADFGLEELNQGIETDILCQYFKSVEPQKEIHGLSNKLSEVFNINAE